MRFSSQPIGRSPPLARGALTRWKKPPRRKKHRIAGAQVQNTHKKARKNIRMQEVGVRVPPSSGSRGGLPIQLTPVNHQATISLTSAAPRGSRGSSRGSSVGGESSEENLLILQQTTPQSSGDGGSAGAHSSGGEEECSPMDLSSGGNGHADWATAALPTMALLAGHPLFNPRKLEALKARHLAQQQRELNETTPPSNGNSNGSNNNFSGNGLTDLSRLPKKRPWPDQPDLPRPTNQDSPSSTSSSCSTIGGGGIGSPAEVLLDNSVDAEGCKRPLIPLELIRAKWVEAGGGRCSPTSPEATQQNTGREVKKRRLDALLNRKFAVSDGNGNNTAPAASPQQQKHDNDSVRSGENGGRSSSERKTHRRKQAHPTTGPLSPPSPPALRPQQSSPPSAALLSIRPNSELFPLTPQALKTPPPLPLPLTPTTPTQLELLRDHLAASTVAEEEQETLKGQILQLQLAQAALLSGAAAATAAAANEASGPSPPGPTEMLLKSALFGGQGGGVGGGANPLLYYGYYAQVLQGLQAQQHKLVEKLVCRQQEQQQQRQQPKSADDIVKDLLNRSSGGRNGNIDEERENKTSRVNGFKLPTSPVAGVKDYKTGLGHMLPFNPAVSLSSVLSGLSHHHQQLHHHSRTISPRRPSSCGGGDSPDGSAGVGANGEPRRRAPRALTGRYVKSGTGASRRTLEILRNKIVERMKLKELLGENSHLYFGALNKQKKGGGAKIAVRK